MRLSDSNLEVIRTRPQRSNLFLSIFQPRIIMQALVNDPAITVGARSITFDTVSFGSDLAIEAGMTLWVGTSAGAKDVGKVRIKSKSPTVLTVAENSDINWADNLFLTVYRYWEIAPVYPRIINDPSNAENVIFYKDYDIPYTNQNEILGTFINMGSHRASFLDNGSTQLWYTSSGTVHVVTGTALSFDWSFEGGTPSGSTLRDPGWVLYSQPGQYVTRLIVSGSNQSVDTSYRYVSIYNRPESGTNTPFTQWSLDSLSGSRGEGGYRASITIYQTSQIIEDGSVVVLFGEDWYNGVKTSLGGNNENNGGVFFVGHVVDGSIEYDYEKSQVRFEIASVTSYMKEMDGFSISVETNGAPSKWFQIKELDVMRAIYHYLRWQTTVMSTTDFMYPATTPNPLLQYFDADRTSLFDAIDSFMRSTIVGKAVSDRQGKVWLESDITILSGTFSNIMNISRRDWRDSPIIDENLVNKVSYLEMGGIRYDGNTLGTFAALLACAPGGTPAYRGRAERIEGLGLSSQDELNRIVANLYAFKNARFQLINLNLSGNYRNLDIAPQEPLLVSIAANETSRGTAISKQFSVDSMSWDYAEKDNLLLPSADLTPLESGSRVETITIPDVPASGGFSTPSVQVPVAPPANFPASFGTIFSNKLCVFRSNVLVSNSDYPSGRNGIFTVIASQFTKTHDPYNLITTSVSAGQAKVRVRLSGFYMITMTASINPIGTGRGLATISYEFNQGFADSNGYFSYRGIVLKQQWNNPSSTSGVDSSVAKMSYIDRTRDGYIQLDFTEIAASGLAILAGVVEVTLQFIGTS